MEAVIGSRTITAFDFSTLPLTNVVTGGAPGIDQAVEIYCHKNHISCLTIRPDYGRYPPKVAPLMRNREIIERASIVYAIWDGKSRGTKSAIDIAYKLGKPIQIFHVTPQANHPAI